MDKRVESIEKLGFREVGNWTLKDEEIFFVPKREQTQKKIVYAFVVDNVVEYVGVTADGALEERMGGYQNPGKSQFTNIRINGKIKDLLNPKCKKSVIVYAVSNDEIRQNIKETADFINFAVGLEAGLIKEIKPEWNIKGKGEQNEND
jgi:hypothetical protein